MQKWATMPKDLKGSKDYLNPRGVAMKILLWLLLVM
jgi:hypothetical protein